jgi:hypothetical protein
MTNCLRPASRVAAPLRLREAACRQIADVPARFEFLPPGRELAAHEMQHALGCGRLGAAGVARDSLAKRVERRIEAPQILQHEPEIEVRRGEARRDRDRASARRFGFARLPDGAQRMPEIGAGFCIVRLELDRAAEMRRRRSCSTSHIVVPPNRMLPGILIPAFPQSVVDRALERDAAAASAEYLAQFRSDLEVFISREAVEACVARGPLRAGSGCDSRRRARAKTAIFAGRRC